MPDPGARAAILVKVRERIVRFAASKVGAEYADDLANDTIQVVETKYRDKDSEADLIPLAVGVMKNKIREFRRQRDRGHAPLDEARAAAADDSRDADLRRLLYDSIARLGPRCRELFRLQLEGYTSPEIQRRLGARTLRTLYTWTFRCTEELRKIMNAAPAANKETR